MARVFLLIHGDATSKDYPEQLSFIDVNTSCFSFAILSISYVLDPHWTQAGTFFYFFCIINYHPYMSNSIRSNRLCVLQA